MSSLEDPNELIFNRKWSIWFHKIDDDNWDNKSYRHVYKFGNISEYWKLMNNLPSITSCMLFLMEDNIFPTYEDPLNYKGGSWSYRILRKDLKTCWEELCLGIVGESIFEEEDAKIINGVSINPKNCVIKIWTRQNNLPSGTEFLNFKINITAIDPNRAIFTNHIEKSNNSKLKGEVKNDLVNTI